MSIYTEYELRCDCRGDAGRYDCEPAIYGHTEAQVWAEARDAGWVRWPQRNGEWTHYKPGHEPTGGAR